MAGEDNTSNLRVASFACYLNTAEENNMLRLAGAKVNKNEGENSIFGAKKYYEMKLNYESSNIFGHHKEASKPNLRTSTLQRNPSQKKGKAAFGTRFFSSFGCSGACLGKKAVNFDKTVTKQLEPELKAGEQFEEGKIEKEPRKSLEVFGSDMTKKGDIATNLERKLSILTWDAIPKAQSHTTENFGSNTVCDDMASEASSDLFEIGNIDSIGYSNLTREVSENTSCSMTPTTRYAPSEASIEWSVVTASAADYDDKNVSKSIDEKVAKKCRPSGLLGCKTHKAVRVAKSAYRACEKTNR